MQHRKCTWNNFSYLNKQIDNISLKKMHQGSNRVPIILMWKINNVVYCLKMRGFSSTSDGKFLTPNEPIDLSLLPHPKRDGSLQNIKRDKIHTTVLKCFYDFFVLLCIEKLYLYRFFLFIKKKKKKKGGFFFPFF